MPFYINRNFENKLYEYFSSMQSWMNIRPIGLGGVSGPGGGSGGPPGGFYGYLPQSRVAYDTSELSSSGLPASGWSILDNLNHIRYRITVIEASGGGSGSFSGIEVQKDDSIIGSGITILNFEGSVDVSKVGNKATIVVTSSGGSSSGGGGTFETGTGALVRASGYSGNARGAAAVDLQKVREENKDVAGGYASVIVGGEANENYGGDASVLGGYNNRISLNADYSVITGGDNNTISGATNAVIFGGTSNTINPSGYMSVIIGGWQNYIDSEYALGYGKKAKIIHPGSVVFTDRNNYDFYSMANDEFATRFTGGYRFITLLDGAGSIIPSGLITFSGAKASFQDLEVRGTFSLDSIYEKVSNKGTASGYAPLIDSKVPTTYLGGAGADSTKILYGDQTWRTPSDSDLAENWWGKVHVAFMDGNPFSAAEVGMTSSTTFSPTLTPTNIGTTVGRLVGFRFASPITVTTIRWFGIASVASIYTAAIYRDSDGVRLWNPGSISTANGAWSSMTGSGLPMTLSGNTLYWFGIGANTTGTTAGFCGPIRPREAALMLASSPFSGLDEAGLRWCQVTLTAGTWPDPLPSKSNASAWTGTVPIFFLCASGY